MPTPIKKISDDKNKELDEKEKEKLVNKALEKKAKRPYQGKGINAITLIRKILKAQLKYSKYVAVRSIKKHKTKPLVRIETITKVPGESPRSHITNIYAADPDYEGKLYNCPAIRVSCNCKDFLFRREVALTLKNAAEIRYSNGDMPIETNPQLIPATCKHIFKALLYIVSHRL